MNRQKMLDQLERVREWDILIIGGGATGLGAAVDAASRGYKTLLVEQIDFAKGTSSRSTKLVHGGVRYLAQGNIKLVKESLRERGLLLKNASHVCHSIPFILPFFSWWEKWYFGLGLKLYDLLSGKWSLGQTRILSRKKTLSLLPSIAHRKLAGSVLYYDGQFDDSRLAINLAQTATEQGAAIINYCRLISFVKAGTRISGVVITDTIAGTTYTVNAKVVVNATGVFTDDLMQLDDPQTPPMLTVSQGVHIVVDPYFFPGKEALIIPGTDDGRVLFAVPWNNKVIIGTTDTPISEPLVEPAPLAEEIDFILRHMNRFLATAIQRKDIRSVFAGLRPLVKASGRKHTAFLSRDHSIFVSKSGLVTITGGKWTTYRTMARDAIDKAAEIANLPLQNCVTDYLPIHGNKTYGSANDHLSVYGSDAEGIRGLMKDNSALQEKIHPELPYLKAEVIWAVREEMAMTIEDILARRTRSLFLDARVAKEAGIVTAALMANEMGQTKSWEEKQVRDFHALANQYLIH